MENNTSNFNIMEVCRITKIMHEHRRGIMRYCYAIMETYNNFSLLEWDGLSRADFHKKMFGEDDQTGIVGQMLSICTILNNLLYTYAVYVSNVFNANAGPNYGTYSYEDFIDGFKDLKKTNINILYSNINIDNVIVSNKRFKELTYMIKQYYEIGIKNPSAQLNKHLNELATIGIMDETVSQVGQQIQKIEEISNSFGDVLSTLLEKINELGQISSTESRKTQETVELSLKEMNQIYPDYE